jgi:hypothetical protein
MSRAQFMLPMVMPGLPENLELYLLQAALEQQTLSPE